MALPESLAGWLNAAAIVWSLLAYGFAAWAGTRALRCAYEADAAPPPACLIADATRWLFGRPLSSRRWRARDFVAVGVFGATVGAVIMAALHVWYLVDLDWRALGHGKSLYWSGAHIIAGSSLIILHCGVALRFGQKIGGMV